MRRAVAWHNQGRADAAESIYRQILARKPQQVDALHLLGVLHLQAGRAADALPLLERAAALAPASDLVLGNYALALDAAGRMTDARRMFERALALKPHNPGTHSNLGGLLQRMGDYPAALAAYTSALRIDPHFADGLYNLGSLHLEYAEADAALAAFERALEIAPDNGRYRWNRAWCLLLLGRLKQGFAAYEHRWENPDFAPFKRRLDRPEWRGEPLAGKMLLLWAEQGLGDTLQFIRYVALVRRRVGESARIVVECDALLAPLLRHLQGVDAVTPRGTAPPDGIDVHRALMSLPHVFETTNSTVPAETPYLSPPPEPRAAGQRVAALRGRKIGLVWAGNQANVRDARRSIPLARLAQLPYRDDVTFVSLQKGDRARRELATGGNRLPIVD
ncbi:MAG: tetratricopeptide repeat protein, partial [Alphaproteobacteria bacterium]